MLKLSSTVTNLPIYSLRTGHAVGLAGRPLINPNNLKIEAWFAESRFDNGLLLLPVSEIRELSAQAFAVNDKEAITPAEDLIRLEPLIKLDFQLLGKKVYDENREYLGKVNDFATDTNSFFIQRLYVAPSVFKSFTQDQRIVSRAQIIEITDKKIVVKATTVRAPGGLFKSPRPATAPEA